MIIKVIVQNKTTNSNTDWRGSLHQVKKTVQYQPQKETPPPRTTKAGVVEGL